MERTFDGTMREQSVLSNDYRHVIERIQKDAAKIGMPLVTDTPQK